MWGRVLHLPEWPGLRHSDVDLPAVHAELHGPGLRGRRRVWRQVHGVSERSGLRPRGAEVPERMHAELRGQDLRRRRWVRRNVHGVPIGPDMQPRDLDVSKRM